MAYIPDPKILQNYARVMVEFALGNTKGIQQGERVLIHYFAPAKPLALEVYRIALERGAHPFVIQIDDDFAKLKFEVASDEQLSHFNTPYYRGIIDSMDHRITLLAEENPLSLQHIDPKKLILANKSKHQYKKWFFEKVDAGEVSWTLCLYGTEAMAREAGMSIEEYWNGIADACYLHESDPVSKWREVDLMIRETQGKLNALAIKNLHIKAEKTDLWVTMGEGRQFISGDGNNIPSFEIFTSPDWRGTEGTIYFDYPLYRYGNIIKGIQLTFEKGEIIRATAEQNEQLLTELIAQKNANKIGEFSLTDKRFSKINRFMAETLYDENFGGAYGNTHIAVGSSYHDTFTGDATGVTESDWSLLGYNESVEHTDIMATTPRTVTAVLPDGSEQVIYKEGEFVI